MSIQITVTFSLIGPDRSLWTEDSLAAEGAGLQARLARLSPLYGMLSICSKEQDECISITDDFDFLLTDFCLMLVPALARGEDVIATLAADDETVTMTQGSGPDGPTIVIGGSSIPDLICPRGPLLKALVDCGARYVALKEAELGAAGTSMIAGLHEALRQARTALN